MNQPTPNGKPNVLVTGVSGMIGSAICRELGPDEPLIGLDVESPHEHFEDPAKRS